MRVLITWGSKNGGTAGIARIVARALTKRGFDVVKLSAEDVKSSDLERADAVIIGGALYANRWPGNVRRFVRRNVAALRRKPVWFFSSGPLDDSADRGDIDATEQVSVLAERVGALGHVTFGGRLDADVQGFPAAAMAKEHAGDWRNPERIGGWADGVANQLPRARPGMPIDHPPRALHRALAPAVGAWLAGVAVMFALPFPFWGAIAHAALVVLVIGALSWSYFGQHGAREPLPTALMSVVFIGGLDLGLATLAYPQALAMWPALVVALVLAFAAVMLNGFVRSTMPWREPEVHMTAKKENEPKRAA